MSLSIEGSVQGTFNTMDQENSWSARASQSDYDNDGYVSYQLTVADNAQPGPFAIYPGYDAFWRSQDMPTWEGASDDVPFLTGNIVASSGDSGSGDGHDHDHDRGDNNDDITEDNMSVISVPTSADIAVRVDGQDVSTITIEEGESIDFEVYLPGGYFSNQWGRLRWRWNK